MTATTLILTYGILATPASPVCPLEETATVMASGTVWGDAFGTGVAISGTTAVLGAPLADDHGYGSGAAVIFNQVGSSWTQHQRLAPSDSVAGDGFGTSVAASGDYIAIGAPEHATKGAVYIYVRSGSNWNMQQKLMATDGADSDWFGTAVSLDGDRVIVGAYGDDDAGSASGSAYVFRRQGSSWVQEQKIVPTGGAAFDNFGTTVSLSGDRAIVGARYDDDHGSNSGSAFVFRRSSTTWIQEQKLTPSDGAAHDYFGMSVGISGDLAVIGASRDDDACPSSTTCDSGSAYVFRRNGSTWAQEQKLIAPDAGSSDYFGLAVSISGGLIAVGAYGDDDLGFNAGAIYVFRQGISGFSAPQKLTASSGTYDDEMGKAVAASGTSVIAGAPASELSALYGGVGYIYTAPADDSPECSGGDTGNPDINGDGVVNGVDLGILLSHWSIPTTAPGCAGLMPCVADLNVDGFVNGVDLGILLNNWG